MRKQYTAGFDADYQGCVIECDIHPLWPIQDHPVALAVIAVVASEIRRQAGMAHSLGLLRTLAQALRLWAWGGIACDLVVLNTEPSSYPAALHHEIQTLRDRHGADGGNPARPWRDRRPSSAALP